VKKSAFIVGFLTVFVVGLWLIAIPESLIIDLIENSQDKGNIYLETDGFKKGLFYNFSADRIHIKKKGAGDTASSLLVFDGVRGRLDIMSLLRLSPVLDFDSKLNKGEVEGSAKLTEKGSFRIHGKGIQTDGIPVLESIGYQGEGDIRFGLRLTGGTGEAQFFIDNLKVKHASLSGIFLPLDKFTSIRGSVLIRGKTIQVTSLAVDGEGIYARFKGTVTGNYMDMNLELMLDADFEPESLIRTMLVRYKIAPGYYIIPIKYRLPLVFLKS
jgi:type II secretion system protein N